MTGYNADIIIHVNIFFNFLLDFYRFTFQLGPLMKVLLDNFSSTDPGIMQKKMSVENQVLLM